MNNYIVEIDGTIHQVKCEHLRSQLCTCVVFLSISHGKSTEKDSYGLTGDLVALLNNPLIIPYSSWKYKFSKAIMCHERESMRAWCALYYPSLVYYVQSVKDISICSWWKLAINIPTLLEACRVVMTLITSFNITNRGRWCDLCDSFEPDTLDHMVARCGCFVNQRTDYINELYISCEYIVMGNTSLKASWHLYWKGGKDILSYAWDLALLPICLR